MKKSKEERSADRVEKIETGISGFDLISIGGLPKGRSTLLTGTSGSAKTMFGIQFLHSGIEQFNEPGVFVTFEETPADIIRNVTSLGWDLQASVDAGKLAFVDVSPEPGEIAIEVGDYDFSAFIARIEHAANKVKAKRVCVDSIGVAFSHYAEHRLVRAELFRMIAALKQMGLTTLITAERVEEYGSIARYDVEEFVSDNVVVVRNVLEAEKRRRTVEVLKMRGAMHQKGEFPFTISKQGIEVLPLSSMELTQRSSDVRLPTGNAVLDEMSGGGFFRDSIILISGATGTGKTLSATTFLDEGCRRGEKVLLFGYEESREQMFRNAKGWGMDFELWEKEGLLKVVCAYPETMGIEDHLLSIKDAIEAFEPNRIAIDSLSAMQRGSTDKSFREFVIGLTAYIKKKEMAGLFTTTTETLMGGGSVTETHISTITDTILLLRYVEVYGEMRRGITILKMRGSMHEKSIREYIVDSKGMQIGKPFQNIGGILSGSPVYALEQEEERLRDLFDKDKG